MDQDMDRDMDNITTIFENSSAEEKCRLTGTLGEGAGSASVARGASSETTKT